MSKISLSHANVFHTSSCVWLCGGGNHKNHKRVFYRSHILAVLFLGGPVTSEPLQRQLAAHLCELEPEGRSLAGLPGGKAEGRWPLTGCRTSHQTWRSAHTGTGTGECTAKWAKDRMKELRFDWLEAGKAGYSRKNPVRCGLQTSADDSTASKC